MTELTKSNLAIKGLLVMACFVNLIQGDFQIADVRLILLIMLTTLVLEYRQTNIVTTLVLITTVLICFWVGKYALFLPVILFDSPGHKNRWLLLFSYIISMLFILVNYTSMGYAVIGYLFTALLSTYMGFRQTRYVELADQYASLHHTSEEQQFTLEEQHSRLLEEQNNNLTLGISAERNRIARDIHDNVGHLLSSALIQLGAVTVINKDQTLVKPLELVSQTVEEGMNNIRQSVHDLYDDSLNLEQSVANIVQTITDYQISFRYTITSPLANQVKIDLLMVIRESLANILKHSNGTTIRLELVEQPAFFRLSIKDNGTQPCKGHEIDGGIGLFSMQKRIALQAGRLTAEQQTDGFQVLAIIPKDQGGQ